MERPFKKFTFSEIAAAVADDPAMEIVAAKEMYIRQIENALGYAGLERYDNL